MTLYSYTNEYIDSYIKLIYLRSRMYDPASGRFTTKDSWQGDYNRPLSLNRWMYVAGNPVNYIDPSGLCGLPGEPPCPPENGAVSVPDWWKNENKRQLYVEGLGYFDSEHIERGWREAAWFVKEIEAALSRNQGGMSPLARATSGDYYWVDYAVSAKIEKNDQKKINGIAYGMFIDFERGYEEYQDSKFPSREFLLLQFFSGFAPADLPSDHLGFWAYMSGYERDEIPGLLSCLGKVEVLFPQLWGVIIDSTGFPENHEFLPMIRETVRAGRFATSSTRNIAWPAFLEIQPIPSGPNTWQVLNRIH